MPCGLVEALIEMADCDGILQFSQKLKVGGPVRLLAGPFADQLAILDHLDDAGRVRVLLDILGRQVRISTVLQQSVGLPGKGNVAGFGVG